MIDWVSIVRSSGQRFSNVIVPNKVRRKRRKRRLKEQHDQIQRQFGPGSGSPNAITNPGCGSGSSISSPSSQCICDVGNFRSGSFSTVENKNAKPVLRSSSFGCSSGSGACLLPSSCPTPSTFRYNSLCEVHGKLVSV